MRKISDDITRQGNIMRVALAHLVGITLIVLIMLFVHNKAQPEVGDDQETNALLVRRCLLLL